MALLIERGPHVATDTMELAKLWAKNTYFDSADRAEIQKLIDDNDTKEIEERFYKDLEFGTGGMRAILGMGSNRIHKYAVRKATQAMCDVVAESYPGQNNSFAICYDSRTFSFEFAKEVASVVAGNGMTAYIYDRLNPVALLSWSIRHHKCKAGVMITASHNPTDYNGFKAYWDDGAQLTPPYDKKVIEAYNGIKDFNVIKTANFDSEESAGKIVWVGKDVEDTYYSMLKKYVINPELCAEKGGDVKLVYTPIHGTGLHAAQRVFEEMGLKNNYIVEEQAQPDSKFPTVDSPNPENPEALAMAVELMKKVGADVAMGTDPDTDRLGVAFLEKGEVRYLNGNQLAVLMLNYVLTGYSEQGRLPSNPYVIKTIVTSELQTAICKNFNVEILNTLTGFKWICGKIKELEKSNPEKNYVFSSEESFGYLPHKEVRDKDGVASLALFSEMMLWYKNQDMNLVQALDKIYDQYGFFHEELLCMNYYGKEGGEKIQRIMDNFRATSDGEILGEKIASLTDVQTGKLQNFETNESTQLDLPTSNVLGFSFKSGNKLWIRPSGTEPKVKFYIMLKESQGTLAEKKARAYKKACEVIEYLKKESNRA